MIFIYCRQAFDSVNRKALYDTLEDFGIPLKLIQLVKITLNNSQTKIVVGSQVTRSFAVTSGVR
jgi:hypothetical protein